MAVFQLPFLIHAGYFVALTFPEWITSIVNMRGRAPLAGEVSSSVIRSLPARGKARAFLIAGLLVFMASSVLAATTMVAEHPSSEANPPEVLPDGSVVSYEVRPIKQPTPMSCWAAVYAMMQSWRGGRTLTIPEAVATLGPLYSRYLSVDDGLPGGAEQDLVARAGMRALPPASYPLSTIRSLLRERGPLWVTAGDGITAHARLLVSIYSPDESESAAAYERSWLKFIDPEDGTFRFQKAIEFERLFEQEAAFLVGGHMDNVPLRWQIITF